MKNSTKAASRKKAPSAPLNAHTPTLPNASPAAAFPIVGIGASAGGLEALVLFLENVPEKSGLAFVIVQHLDPTHKGLIAELLQRATAMKVMEVKDCTRVQPDCVYVIPPNKDLSILHGVLHLFDPVVPRGLRLPIDLFLRSLADDAAEHSIGVILSGMGSDGTLGLKAIKGKAGAVFVQDPASAKFDGMPKSAIDTGLADVVAPVEALPGKIIAYLEHLLAQPGLGEKDDLAYSGFEKIMILLRAQTGHDFSFYKKQTLYRRVERRMSIHQIDQITSYVRFLQENPKELELLFKQCLIGVTSFFRDPAVWEQLKAEVFSALVKASPPSHALRAWIPACSTGEEAYSLAIVFKEILEQLKPASGCTLQIFATDLDKDAVETARAGLFPANIAADVSPERLARFFVPVASGYQVGKSIREMVIFAEQNLIMDPPFTRLDLVSCRNVLIYLMPELQKKILPLFHYSLKPGGVLLLGSAETAGGFTNLFAPLAGKTQLYRRIESGQRAEPVVFPAAFRPARKRVPPALPPAASFQSQAEQLLLQQYSPAAVLVNDQGDILFINGRTGKYLEPAAGKANLNLFAMAREGLRYELSDAFRMALRQNDAVIRKSVKVATDAGVQAVDLTVQAITEPVTLRGLVMVVFTDVATPLETKGVAKANGSSARNARMSALERDFAQTRQELQITREEMQTSEEESKSANEEMQSTNEEMQSTNEEMQSLNEELQTISAELRNKVENLSDLTNDQKNLLDATEIATLFLNPSLRVRLFTAGANRVFKLIPSDVGRAITDIVSELDYPELADHAREVLRTLAIHEQSAATRDGDRFLVRIKPYRTFENMIDGVVITLTDITETKRKEEALKKANDLLRLAVVVRDAHDAVTVQDLEGRIIAWNPGAVRMYGWSEAEALEMNVRNRIPEGLRQDALDRLLKLGKAEILEPYRTQRFAKDGTVKDVSIISTALVNETGQIYAISTTERGRGQ